MDNNNLKIKAKELCEKMTIDEKVLQLASFFPNGVLRLKVPNLQPGECLHGIAVDYATSFPQAIAMGSTFDPELIERISTVIAKEARAVGVAHCYTPMLGVVRDIRWGRCEESYGEDTYLVSKIGEAFINGLQGRGEERFNNEHVMATAKHYVADAQPMAGNNGAPVEISHRELHEVHLPPFKTAVIDAKVGAIMPAHHSLNGQPCHMNEYIINDVLRTRYGFDGLIVSDNGDIRMLCTKMGVAKDLLDAAKKALKATVDSELAWMCPMGENRAYGTILKEALENNEIEVDLVDRAVCHVLEAKYALGLFDDFSEDDQDDFFEMQSEFSGDEHIHYADTKRSFGKEKPNYKEVLFNKDHDNLALEAAKKSIILLKNENNLLPLNVDNLNKIAIIGPNSDTRVLGGYSTKNPRHFVTILDGISKYVGDKVEIIHENGLFADTFLEENIEKAVLATKEADVTILCVGGNEETCKENEDVDSLAFVGDQQKLIKAVCDTKKPVIMVLMHGRPNAIEFEKNNIDSILECFYLGQECGSAVSEVLFGKYNPGGKLPVTIPRNVGQLPYYYNKLPHGRERKYYESDVDCLYPFGYGLSYTTFEISKPLLSSEIKEPSKDIVVSVCVTNTGKRAGEEVVQLYLHDTIASLTRPSIELKGFKRIYLEPNETKKVSFNIDEEKLAFFMNERWIVEDGEFEVYVGNSSQNLKMTSFIRKSDGGNND